VLLNIAFMLHWYLGLGSGPVWTAKCEVRGSNPGQGRNLVRAPPAPLANSDMMSTLTAHCQWENETVRERTGHPPSYAVAKKIKSLTLHTHGCLRSSLRDWSNSSSPLDHYVICSFLPLFIHSTNQSNKWFLTSYLVLLSTIFVIVAIVLMPYII